MPLYKAIGLDANGKIIMQEEFVALNLAEAMEIVSDNLGNGDRYANTQYEQSTDVAEIVDLKILAQISTAPPAEFVIVNLEVANFEEVKND